MYSYHVTPHLKCHQNKKKTGRLKYFCEAPIENDSLKRIRISLQSNGCQSYGCWVIKRTSKLLMVFWYNQSFKKRLCCSLAQINNCIIYLQIKMENLAEYCLCAGQFQTLLNKRDIGLHLRTFHSISQHFGMVALEQTIDWMISQSPSLKDLANKS